MQRSITFLLLALAQWPLCALSIGLFKNDDPKVNFAGIITLLAGMALCGAAGRAKLGGLGIMAGSGLIGIGILAAFRDFPIQFILVLSGFLWLLAAFALFSAGWRRCSILAFNVALVALLAILGEWIVGAVQQPEIQSVYSVNYRTEDPEMSSRHIPGASCQHRKIAPSGEEVFNVCYTIDSDGSRLIPGRPAAGPRWAFFGGSFCFGLGLDDAQTIPAVIQTLNPEVRVFNYGIQAHGTGDAYIYLRRVLNEESDTACCVYFIIKDHFRRTACPDSLTSAWGAPKPRFALESNQLVYLGKAEDTLTPLHQINVKLLRSSRLYSRAFQFFERDPWSSYPLVTEMVLGMQRACAETGSCKFLLAILPQDNKFENGERQRLTSWSQTLGRQGVAVLDCDQKLDDYCSSAPDSRREFFLEDGHPNARCAKMIGGWVSAELKEFGPKLVMSTEERDAVTQERHEGRPSPAP